MSISCTTQFLLFLFQGIHPDAVRGRWGRLESTLYRAYAGKTFVLHTVKLAHYDKMNIRIYLLSIQHKKQSHFYLMFPLGLLPDSHILASGAKLSEICPRPLIPHILEGISSLELVPSQFGPVPRGCTLSYQRPPLTPDKPVIDFLPLPSLDFRLALIWPLSQISIKHTKVVTKSFPNYSLRS